MARLPKEMGDALSLFTDPGKPDHSTINAIHRGNDGVVAISRKPEGKYEERGGIPADELGDWFPQFIEELERDSYFSINAFYVPTRKRDKRVGAWGDLPDSRRRKSNARWLTSSFVDIDCYGRGLTQGQVIGTLFDYQNSGKIPPFSLLVNSGRGVWAFWLLRNEDERYPKDGPVRAWPENVAAFSRLQRKLHGRLARLGADANSLDVARVTRVAGSTNSKSKTRVTYLPQLDERGKWITHSLDELAAFFKLPLLDRKLYPKVRSTNSERIALGKQGHHGRWIKNWERFEHLRKLRGGGFREGLRYHACWVYASILEASRRSASASEDEAITEEALRELVIGLGEDCLDASGQLPMPLDPVDIEAAISKREALRAMTNQSLSDRLLVTSEESESINAAVYSRSGAWPPARAFQSVEDQDEEGNYRKLGSVVDPSQNLSKVELREMRRDRISKIVEATGSTPSLEAIADQLEEHGLKATPRTISKDLDALGIERKRRISRQLPLLDQMESEPGF